MIRICDVPMSSLDAVTERSSWVFRRRGCTTKKLLKPRLMSECYLFYKAAGHLGGGGASPASLYFIRPLVQVPYVHIVLRLKCGITASNYQLR